jgi:hypothetical protein
MASKSSSRILTDHAEIRRWAEERGAKPSTVKSTHSDDDVGIIRLDFPGFSGQGSLEEISWDEWFEDFEDNNLALVVQDENANGQKSNFNKLVSRENVESGSNERSSRSKKTSSRSNSGKSSTASARNSSGTKSSSGTHKSRGKKAA